MRIEDQNYYNDHRVAAAMMKGSPWLENIDLQKMTARIEFEHYLDIDPDFPEDGSKIPPTVPLVFEVCPTCQGRGSHVNPSIDCGGLSRDDFAEDPDFAADYFNGRYDVPCYGCNGRRVVPVIDEDRCDKALLKHIQRWERNHYQAIADERAEMAIGY